MFTESLSGRNSVLGLAECLHRRALQAPQQLALTCEDLAWTYGELWQQIERLSAVLQALGVGVGDRVGHLDFDSPMFIATQFASARIGAIFVPLNFRLSATELAGIINHAELHVLLVGSSHQSIIDGMRADLTCQHYLSLQAAALYWPSVLSLMAQVEIIPPAIATPPEMVAALMYTSGTTGEPKGVMLTQQNFWSQCENVTQSKKLSSSDVALACVPLFHVGGMLALSLPLLLAGGHVVLQRRFDAGAVLRDITRYRITSMFAVPAMLLLISQHVDFSTADLRTLRLLSVGGAPLALPLLQTFAARSIPVQQGYGMTETAATVTFLSADRALDKLGSCGKAGMMTAVCLKDPDGREVQSAGSKGEVCMRGGNVMLGYWRNPAATAAVFDAEGWLHSGDLGYFDEEGFLYLCDRLKDVIISGGENIYPAEVESILYEHPAVAECAIVGKYDTQWGERVVAVVVLKPSATLTLEDIHRLAENRLARYKLPRELYFMSALPRNAAGKILKARVREQLSEQS